MRSAAYSAMWKPKQAMLLAVRAFMERRRAQGRIAHLLLAKKAPADPEGAAAIAESAGFTVELNDGNLALIV